MNYTTLSKHLTFICGPCVIEDEEETLETARRLKEIFTRADLPWIFKSSFDKANRMSHRSFRGPGLKKGLEILKRVKQEVGVSVTSDIHTPEEAQRAADVLDIIQIPAFLCRQTDLVVAAAKTGKIINIKKGQFCAPWDMKSITEKVKESGNDQLILTDRGASFGYNNLVSDMRAIPIMKELGAIVCFDASHSVQLPGGLGDKTGGQRQFIPTLARCAVAAGADMIFIESHLDPSRAKSDAASQLPLDELEGLVNQLKRLYHAL